MRISIPISFAFLAFLSLPAMSQAPSSTMAAAFRQGVIVDLRPYPAIAALPTTRVSADFDKLTPAAAARAIKVLPAFEYGPVWSGTPGDEHVSLHLQDVPLMQAAMEYQQQSHTRLVQTSTDRLDFYYDGENRTPLWSVAGPFAVLLCGLSREIPRDTPPDTPPTATLRMDLLAEPGIAVTRCLRSLQCPDLQDDKHQPIQAERSFRNFSAADIGKEYCLGVSGDTSVEFLLKLPNAPGRRIPLLRGTLDATFIAKTQPLNIPNLKDKQTLAIAGMTVEVTPNVHQDALHSVNFRFRPASIAPAQWNQLRASLTAARLSYVRTDGQRGTTISLSGTVGPGFVGSFGRAATLPDEVSASCSAPRDLDPAAALTLDVPVDVRTVYVPFEFHDVILP
jgi:hypothetical protein